MNINLDDILGYYNNIKFNNFAEKAYVLLEELIISTLLTPGKIYNEIELSKLISIGRTPVREAVKKLETTHIVEIIPRRGIKISEVRLEDFLLQLEVRRMLERLIAIRASKFATPSERNYFLELADRYDEATESGNRMESIRIDNEFNKFVADCARNPFAKNALLPLHAVARRLYFNQYSYDKELTKRINSHHSLLMRTIASGNSSECGKVSDELISYIEELMKIQLNIISTN
jgi:DNA-binding GntR family transcriptional regulator